MSLKQKISKMFREDYYLRNRVSTKDFYEFKDRIIGLVSEREEKLQKLQDDVVSYLNDYDIIEFAKKHNIKMDNWLKSQLFDLMGDIRTEIIMKFAKLEKELKQ